MKTCFLSLMLVAVFPVAGVAQDIPDNLARAEILPGWQTADGTHVAALRLTLADGWHTYWRSPGEAGIPPRFDWAGSANVSYVSLHWPSPQIFDQNGLRTLGYENSVVIPIDVSAAKPREPVRLAAALDIGVCKDVCVPVSLSIAADLSDKPTEDAAIISALAKGPQGPDAAGVSASTCSAEPIKDGLRVTSTLTLPDAGPDEFAVIEGGNPEIWVQTVSSRRSAGQLVTVVDMVPPDAQPFALSRGSVVITVFGGGKVTEVKGCTG